MHILKLLKDMDLKGFLSSWTTFGFLVGGVWPADKEQNKNKLKSGQQKTFMENNGQFSVLSRINVFVLVLWS